MAILYIVLPVKGVLFMKKKIYIFAIIVLTCIAEVGIAMSQKNDKNLYNAFAQIKQIKINDMCTTFHIQGKYKKGYMSEEDMKNSAAYISSSAGISEESVNISGGSDGKCYVDVNTMFEGCNKSIENVRKNIIKACEKTGFDVRYTTTLQGNIQGKMQERDVENTKDTIFEMLGTDVGSQGTLNSVSMDKIYYGYSKMLEQHIMAGGEKTNITIAFSYDEKNDVTGIYLATPLIDMDI